jgi:hypothetical protein
MAQYPATIIWAGEKGGGVEGKNGTRNFEMPSEGKEEIKLIFL